MAPSKRKRRVATKKALTKDDEIDTPQNKKSKKEEDKVEDSSEKPVDKKKEELIQESIERCKTTQKAKDLFKLLSTCKLITEDLSNIKTSFKSTLFKVCDIRQVIDHLEETDKEEQHGIVNLYSLCDVFPLDYGLSLSHDYVRAPHHYKEWIYNSTSNTLQQPLLLSLCKISEKISRTAPDRVSSNSFVIRLSQIIQMLLCEPEHVESVRKLVNKEYLDSYRNEISQQNTKLLMVDMFTRGVSDINLFISEIMCYLCDAVYVPNATHKKVMCTESAGRFRHRIMSTVSLFADMHCSARAVLDCIHPRVLYICLASPSYLTECVLAYLKLVQEDKIKDFAPYTQINEWNSLFFYIPDRKTWSYWHSDEEVMDAVEKVLEYIKEIQGFNCSIKYYNYSESISDELKLKVKKMCAKKRFKKIQGMYTPSVYNEIFLNKK